MSWIRDNKGPGVACYLAMAMLPKFVSSRLNQYSVSLTPQVPPQFRVPGSRCHCCLLFMTWNKVLLNSLSSLNPNDMSQKSRSHIICCLLSVGCLAGTATAGTGLRLVVTCEGSPLTTGPCPDHALHTRFKLVSKNVRRCWWQIAGGPARLGHL